MKQNERGIKHIYFDTSVNTSKVIKSLNFVLIGGGKQFAIKPLTSASEWHLISCMIYQAVGFFVYSALLKLLNKQRHFCKLPVLWQDKFECMDFHLECF